VTTAIAPPIRRRFWPACLPAASLLAAALLHVVSASVCLSGDFVDPHESSDTVWKTSLDPTVRIISQRRQSEVRVIGQSAEQITIESAPSDRMQPTVTRLLYTLPQPSRLLENPDDNDAAKVWFRCDRDGARLLVRVVLPKQMDPVTGRPVSFWLTGTSYTDVGKWQELVCTRFHRQLNENLYRLRNMLKRNGDSPAVDHSQPYIDQIAIDWSPGPGEVTAYLDHLQFGEYIPVKRHEKDAAATQASSVATGVQPLPPIQIHVDLIRSGVEPFVPRVIPWHGERPEDLASLRVNLVWVPDYTDPNVAGLVARGLRVMATPPRLTIGGPGGGTPSASIMPFGDDARLVSMWNLGTRLDASQRESTLRWAEQVRGADRRNKRVITADVAGEERAYSRTLSLIGASRPALHSGLGLAGYRDWLQDQKQAAHPGSFHWTWLQVEPAFSLQQERAAAGWRPMIVEPEQILLATAVAVSAGYRGFGFWTNTAVDSDAPGANERRLALSHVNLLLDILEPMIAHGKVQHRPKVQAATPRGPRTNQLALGFGDSSAVRRDRNERLKEADNQKRRGDVSKDLQATVLRCENYGQLVVIQWLGEGSQFVPGELAANDVVVVVEGAPETAEAYEVSTTAVTNISRKRRVPGGLEVTLDKLNMVGFIFVTSQGGHVRDLESRVKSVRMESGLLWRDLARAKFERVMETDRELHDLGEGTRDSNQLLHSARDGLRRCDAALQRGDGHAARLRAEESLQLLRILQQEYWFDAVRHLSAPTASPHTLAFSTLPDHWRMMAAFGRSHSRLADNALPTGDFEDVDAMIEEGWSHRSACPKGVIAAAEVVPGGRTGGHCLRVAADLESAGEGTTAAKLIRETPVSASTPAISVETGQIVFVSGWVKTSECVGSQDGCLIFDSLAGPSGAIRYRTASDWKPFQLMREVVTPGEFSVSFAVAGLGEMLVDDVKIAVFDPPEPVTPAVPGAADPRATTKGATWFDRLRVWPGRRGTMPAEAVTPAAANDKSESSGTQD
jgi:hypothetical protein